MNTVSKNSPKASCCKKLQTQVKEKAGSFSYLFVIIFLLFTTHIVKADTIAYQPFSSSNIPTGWTNDIIQGAQGWTFRNAPAFGSASGGYYAVFDDNELGANVFPNEAALTSPVIDCSNRSSVRLKITHYWLGIEYTHGYVEISNNGGTSWTTIMDYERLTRGSLTSPQDTIFDISTLAAGNSNVKIRFRYTDGSQAGKFWYIDDILVYADPDVGVAGIASPDYLSCGMAYSSSEQVKIKITNHGVSPVSNIPVTCIISGGVTATLTQTYTGTLNPGDTATIAFSGTYNFSADTVYIFKIYTSLANDSYRLNDTLYDARRQKVSNYPYIENFNASNGGWRAQKNIPSNDRAWRWGTLPYLNGPEGQGNSWYRYASSTNWVSSYIWLESPVFDFSSISNPAISFDIKYQLHYWDPVWVEYSTDGVYWYKLGTSNDPEWYNYTTNDWRNNDANPVQQWKRVQHSLCNLVGQSCVKLRIIANTYYNMPGTYYFAVDNIRIGESPDVSVIEITNPLNNGCLFSANQPVSVKVHNYGCSTVYNIPITAKITGTTTATLTANIDSIAGSSDYTFTFPTTVNMADTGIYNFKVYTAFPNDAYRNNDTILSVFNAQQIKINTFPYFENFNSGAAYWIKGQSSTDTTREWKLGTLPYLNGPEGNGNSWYLNANSNNTTSNHFWLESPVFDFSNLSGAILSFDIKYQLNYWDPVWVEYSTDGGNNWNRLGTFNDPNWYNHSNNTWQNNQTNPVNVWTNVSQNLCELSGLPCVKFRIKCQPYYGNANEYYFAFDNFSISGSTGYDIQPVAIILPPVKDCGNYTANENIKVVLKNNSCIQLTNIPIKLEVSGPVNQTLNEVFTGTLPTAGSSPYSAFGFYTFSGTVNMSTPGTYTFKVITALPTDDVHYNDTLIEIRRAGSKINSFPYSENFNNNNGGWVSITSDSNRIFLLDTLSYLNGDQGNGKSWYIDVSKNNYSYNYIYLQSPVFDFSSVSNPLLSFDLKYSLHYYNPLWVEYSIDGGNNWTKLGTASDPRWYSATTNDWRDNNNNPVEVWTKYQHSLCNLAGQSCVRLRFAAAPYYNYPKYYYAAIDNISVIDAVDVGIISYVEPVDVGCLFAQDQQVTVQIYNWGCNSVSNIPVVCNISGNVNTTFNDTVAVPVPASSSINFTFDSTLNMTGMGSYYFTTYTNLASDPNHSNDTLSTAINVAQLKITTYPYLETFNAGNGHWIVGQSAADTVREWQLGSLPYLNGPQGNGNSWYINAIYQNTTNTYFWLESPVFDFSNLTAPTLSFDIKYQLNYWNPVWVEYSIDGGNNWNRLGTYNDPNWYNNQNNTWSNNPTNAINTWTQVQQNLCDLSGKPCVKFRIKTQPYYGIPDNYYFAFDNFAISASSGDDIQPVAIIKPEIQQCGSLGNAEQIKVAIRNNTCRPVSGVTMKLEITGPINTTLTEIFNGQIPSAGTAPQSAFAFYTFTGTANMSAPGTYTIKVITSLNTDNIHQNDTLIEIRTNGSRINTFPYSEDFNSYTNGWVSFTNDSNRIFIRDTIPFLNGPQGYGKSWFIETSTKNYSNAYIYLQSPVFNLSGLTNPIVSFEMKYQLHYWNQLWFEYSNNGGATWTRLGSYTDPYWYNNPSNLWAGNHNAPVNSWTRYQHNLCNLLGDTCVRFRFVAQPYYNNPEYHYLAIDNFKIVDGADVGVTAIASPVQSGCLYSNTQTVTVTVFNWGCGAISNIPVSVAIAGTVNQLLNDTVVSSINPGSSANFTFSNTFDMTGIGNYSLTAYTSEPSDINNTNDTSSAQITVLYHRVNTYPYIEKFNSGNGGWRTGTDNPNDTSRIFQLGPLPYLNGPEGNGNSWYMEAVTSNSTNTYFWIESPVFDFSNNSNPVLTLDLKHQLNFWNFFWIEYSTDGGTTWYRLGTYNDPNWYNSSYNVWANSFATPVDHWKTYSHNLCNLAGQSCVKFRIKSSPYYGTAQNYYFAIDNITITNSTVDAQLNFVAGCYGSTYSLDVTITNGNNLCVPPPAITSINVSYSVNGGTATTQNFTGLNITAGNSATITVPNVYIPTANSTVKVWVSYPNGISDQILFNDTIYTTAANWPNCNDHCSNAIELGLGTATVTQNSNATPDGTEDPPFCNGFTLENTVWYYFQTDASGGDVTVIFSGTSCSPASNGIQVSIDQINGTPCNPASYINMYCNANPNQDSMVWNGTNLPPNTYFYITVDGVAGNNCTFDITIQGAVAPLPLDLGPDTTICMGDSIVLNAGSGFLSYLWQDGSTNSTFVVYNSGTYYVNVQAGGNYTLSDTIVVTVVNQPNIVITPDSTICENTSIVLTASGANTYHWSTNQNTASITVSPTQTTTYSVTAYIGNCNATEDVTITTVPQPVATITGTNNICEGQSVLLTGSGGGSYLWNTGQTNASINVTPLSTTTYSLTVSNGYCSDTESFTVNVSPKAHITPGNDTTLCSGASITVSASTGTAYLWNTGATSQQITLTPSADTLISVTVTTPGCISSDSIKIFVREIPVANAGADTTICSNGSATLIASGNGSYQWSNGASTQQIQVSPTTTTTYTLTVNNQGCFDTDDVIVYVTPSPSVSVGQNAAICIGSTYALTSVSASNYDSLLWTTSGTGSFSNNTIINPVYTPSNSDNANGTVTLTCTVYSECGSTSSSMVLTINPMPSVNAPPLLKVCPEADANVSGVTASNYTSLLWATSGSGSFSSNNTLNTTYYSTSADTSNQPVLLIITAANSCGIAKDTVALTFYSNPVANAGEDVVIQAGNSATLSASGGTTYLWTPPTGLSCTDCPTPTASPNATTTYQLLVTDANGCSDIDSVEVKVLYNNEVYIPTAFSPNNDGENDYLYVRGNGFRSLEFAIYDRWGNKVFETTNQSTPWDGTYKGTKLSPQVFVYKVKITFYNNEVYNATGNIHMIY